MVEERQGLPQMFGGIFHTYTPAAQLCDPYFCLILTDFLADSQVYSTHTTAAPSTQHLRGSTRKGPEYRHCAQGTQCLRVSCFISSS